MKIAFFGTSDFSKNILNWILEQWGIEVWLIISQPDKPVGRKKIITPTPIKVFAEEKWIKVFQPVKLKTSPQPSPSEEREQEEIIKFYEELKKWDFDFIVVVAYWKIVPVEVLDAPKYWCINIHGSILPDYRWASPIQEAVKNWDKETWLTIMYMSKWMDEWDILAIEKVNIDKHDNTLDIFDKFEKIGPKLLINTLNWVLDWSIKWKKQDDSKATFCTKISKEDWNIDFKVESWENIYNKFKAYSPWPWIYSYYNDKKISFEDIELTQDTAPGFEIWKIIKNWKKIWVVTSDNKIIILKQVKLEWKKSMDILSFVNWNKDFLEYKF